MFLIRVRIQLSYRLVPYEIEIEASDQTDITYVLGEGFLAKVIDAIQSFIDDCFLKFERAKKTSQRAVDEDS
jgi:3'-phosphoadenosine 5'-phosphosulfate sulfotransferase